MQVAIASMEVAVSMRPVTVQGVTLESTASMSSVSLLQEGEFHLYLHV